MRFLVTGAAGFIGSQLCLSLIALGHQVHGLDCLTDYYSHELKQANLKELLANPNFTFTQADIMQTDLHSLLAGNQIILHLAAQAGVRASWGASFNEYIHHNIAATQKLLECMKDFPGVPMVYASSSSIYGQAVELPTRETSPCRPLSPYGVTKLAAENLCWLYYRNFDLPVCSLRFFTVYGPRQRPDMAFHRFIRAMLEEKEITILGDGLQSRDFTYVDDIINALIAAALEPQAYGRSFNLGGGVRASIKQVLNILEDELQVKAQVKYLPSAHGDVRDTFADTSLARNTFGFLPQVSLQEGLSRQAAWIKDNLPLLQKAGECLA